MREPYERIIREHEGKLKTQSRRFDIIGYVKLFLILLLGYLVYLILSENYPLELIVLFSAAFVVLVIVWVIQDRLNGAITHAKGIVSICNAQIDRIDGRWTAFKDTGAEYRDAGHAYAHDLDVVGPKSLFQFLNTTHTWHGRQTFAKDLLNPGHTPDELRRRQEAISELSGDIVFSADIQQRLSQIGVDPAAETLAKELSDKTPFFTSKTARMVLRFLPVLTLPAAAGAILAKQPGLTIAGLLILAVQILACACCFPKTTRTLKALSQLPYPLGTYRAVMDQLSAQTFSSAKCNEIKDKLTAAAQAIKALSKIADRVRLRHNPLLYFFANLLLLWDVQCAFSLQIWKHKYAPLAERWFWIIGEFESLLCFSHLPNICETSCLPAVGTQKTELAAKALGHPLLPNAHRVANDTRLADQILIVSGSNMSGKTTFLRTVGVNLVLAYAGGFVCAETMTCPHLYIVTSMRVTDDLSEGVSTFYAELKRIAKIIDAAKKHPILFLIDEIFKGTNSVDRLAGAQTVVAKLDALKSVGLLSTHDLELCDLANSTPRIKNYSFSEHYKDNQIRFDYKIKPGQSQTTNAHYLMKMVGILDN